MRVACIGDIVGKPGREMVGRFLPTFRKKHAIDLVIANYENASHGFGLTKKNADELLGYGIDVMTGGNHSWDKKEVFELFESYPLVRPINYPDTSPGEGVIELAVGGVQVAVVSVMGNYTMPMSDNPFIKVDKAVDQLQKRGIKHIIVDMHAEATSEKLVMMQILNGRISTLFGTHTHVGTDDLIRVNGCAYVTDVGLTGCRDQVIGMDKKIPIQRFMTGVGGHFDIPKKCQKVFQLILVDLDSQGRATHCEKFKIYDNGEVQQFVGRQENY